MQGIITRVGRFVSITGDDGEEYIGFWPDLKDPKDKKKYFWKGNRCSFTPEDQGGEHMVATELEAVRELDPERFAKAERKQEQLARHEQKVAQKAANKAKQEKLEDRKALRQWYEKDHLRYVLYGWSGDGEWKPVEPYVISEDLEAVKEAMVQLLMHDTKQWDGSNKVRYAVRKMMVHQVYGQIIFKEPEGKKRK